MNISGILYRGEDLWAVSTLRHRKTDSRGDQAECSEDLPSDSVNPECYENPEIGPKDLVDLD